MTNAGCLQRNPDYQFDPRNIGSVLPNGGTHSTKEKDSDDDPLRSSSSELPLEEKGSTTRGSNSSSHSSSSPLSLFTSNESSSIESSHSNTESSSAPDQSTRLAIEIDATQITEKLLSGFPFSLTFNHQALVRQGAAADGRDLAVVSIHDGVPVPVPRTLDHLSSWNQEDTTIWFVIDEEILPGSVSDDRYFLVTQEPEVVPNSDESKIFTDVEDFGSSALSSTRWKEHLSVAGNRSLTQTSDAVVLRAEQGQFEPFAYIALRQAAKPYWSSVRIDVRTRFTNTGLRGDCGLFFPVALRSAHNSYLRAGLRSDISQYAGLSYDDFQDRIQVGEIQAPLPRSDLWEVHSLSWVQNDIVYWRDGVQLLATQSAGSITLPNQTNLQLEFAVGADTIGCSGSGELGLEIDWFRVRRYTFPEPSARLK